MVDIDDTICRSPRGSDGKIDYTKAEPIKERIAYINNIYDKGHEVHYWTSRGMITGLDWKVLTYEQLTKWGCRYSSLKMKKPMYDIWIDDKSINADTFFDKVLGEKHEESVGETA